MSRILKSYPHPLHCMRVKFVRLLITLALTCCFTSMGTVNSSPSNQWWGTRADRCRWWRMPQTTAANYWQLLLALVCSTSLGQSSPAVTVSTSSPPLVPLPDTSFSKLLNFLLPTTGTEGQCESESDDSGWDWLKGVHGRKRQLGGDVRVYTTDGRTLKRGSGRKSGRLRTVKTSFMRIRSDFQTVAVSAVKGTSVEEFETRMTEVVEAEKLQLDRYSE